MFGRYSTLEEEIVELRSQANILPLSGKRDRLLAKADALEVTMKVFTWRVSPAPEAPCKARFAPLMGV